MQETAKADVSNRVHAMRSYIGILPEISRKRNSIYALHVHYKSYGEKPERESKSPFAKLACRVLPRFEFDGEDGSRRCPGKFTESYSWPSL